MNAPLRPSISASTETVAALLEEAVMRLKPRLRQTETPDRSIPGSCGQLVAFLEVAEECWKRFDEQQGRCGWNLVALDGRSRWLGDGDNHPDTLETVSFFREVTARILHRLERLIVGRPEARELQRMIRLAEVLRYYDRRFVQILARLGACEADEGERVV